MLQTKKFGPQFCVFPIGFGCYFDRRGTAFGPFDTRSFPAPLPLSARGGLAEALPPGGTNRFEVSLAAARYRLAVSPPPLGAAAAPLRLLDLPVAPDAERGFENPPSLPLGRGSALPFGRSPPLSLYPPGFGPDEDCGREDDCGRGDDAERGPDDGFLPL